MPYSAIKPEAGAFGTHTAANAQRMGRADGVGGILSRIALSMAAKQEEGQYLAALQAAQENQLAGSHAENQAEIAKAAITAAAPMAAQGIAGAYGLPNNPYATAIDPELALVNNTNKQNIDQSTYLGNNANSIETLTNAGYTLPAATVGGMMTGAFETAPQTVVPYMNPGDANDAVTAAAQTKQAEAAIVRANKPETSGGGNSQEYYTIESEAPDGSLVRQRVPGIYGAGTQSPTRVVPFKGVADPRLFNKKVPGGWTYAPGTRTKIAMPGT